jgi:hypothetical protein
LLKYKKMAVNLLIAIKDTQNSDLYFYLLF